MRILPESDPVDTPADDLVDVPTSPLSGRSHAYDETILPSLAAM
jgi:hypothetical protein